MRNILVIGASAGIGRAVVAAALAKGHRVRAFSRHAEAMDISHPQLAKVNGNALVPADVEAALAEVDVVVQSLGVPLNLQLLTGPISLFSAATRVLIPTMQAQHVKRLIAVTGFGAGECEQAIHPLQRLGFNLVFGNVQTDSPGIRIIVEGFIHPEELISVPFQINTKAIVCYAKNCVIITLFQR